MEFKTTKNLGLRFAIIACLGAVSMWLSACARKPSDEQLKQQVAQTAQQVKQGAQQAAANAKAAAANAERKVNDIADGVQEGLKSNTKSAVGAIDINSASEGQLVDLPGITDARAKRIIRNRPYSHPRDLVAKGVLTEEQYERISGQIKTD